MDSNKYFKQQSWSDLFRLVHIRFGTHRNWIQVKKTLKTDIWQSLPGNLGHRLPPLSKLSMQQSEELNSILEAVEENLKNLGLTTSNLAISRSGFGYIIKRICHINSCCIVCKVDIKNRSVKACMTNECKENHHN